MPTPGDLDAFVLDLDGVVYRGDSVIPGAPESIARLRREGRRILFATNNATRSPEAFAEKLRGMGVPTAAEEIVTSARVLVEEIERRGLTSRRTFLIGTQMLRSELSNVGLTFLEGEEARSADLVISSNDPDFTYDKLRTAGFALHAGAEFLATNADATFPSSEGLWPGAGSLLAAVQTVSGRRAEVMGKPHRPMMEAIARRLPGCERIGMVGDQPATDLDGASAMGWTTILVLSGVTDAAAAAALDPVPDLILGSLAELQL